MKRLKKLVRYLIGEPDLGVWLPMPGGDPGEVILDGWVDTDWAGDEDTRRSVTSMAIEADGCQLHTRVLQQSIIAQSSGEGEFYGVVKAAGVGLGYVSLMTDVSVCLPLRVWIELCRG